MSTNSYEELLKDTRYQPTTVGNMVIDHNGAYCSYEALALLKEETKSLKQELKEIAAALDDPRTDLTMTMVEVILDLKKQLSASIAACKLKDEALEGLIDTMDLRLDDDDLSLETRTAFEALAVQPDDSALKVWLGEQSKGVK